VGYAFLVASDHLRYKITPPKMNTDE
jgi:hypothetical protein